ncbi:MAG TPA: hypothetical protein VN380_07050 [Thermoanaerobaculia bacterium]|nr:hypothetical protein [Thermoanaerobaculia bacterium]
MTRTLRLFILLLLVPIALAAQSGAWGLRGISQRFLVDGNFIVDVDGAGFSVYDVSAPDTVRRLSRIETNDESIDGSISGNDLVVSTRSAIERYTIVTDGTAVQTMHAPVTGVTLIAWNGKFVAGCTPGGILIWRPAGDGTLANTGAYPIKGTIKSMAWKGDALFVAIADIGIRIIDGNTSQDINYIPEPSRALAISGNMLYSASGGDGVAVIDISDPTAPAITGRALAGTLNLQNIAVAGTRVFAEEPPNRIHIIDASVATAPHEVAAMTEPAQAMAAAGDRLFVSGPTFTAFGDISDNGSPLRVFNLANPATPALTAEVVDANGALAGVATNGSLAYVSDPPFFRVLDVSTTQTPREIASLRVDGFQPHVKSVGTQAILYGTGDVQLIDVSDPYHPKAVKTFHSLGRTPSYADFVATGILEGNSFTGLHLVDFVNYPQPGIVNAFKIHPIDVVANGGQWAYVSLGSLFGVFNYPAPNVGLWVQSVQATALDMAVAQATSHHPDALIVRNDNLRLFTLADPANPIDAGSISMPPPGPLAAFGDSVLIGSPGTLTRMDITDLGNPFLDTTTMHVVAPQQMATASGKVVVADRYSIRVFGPQTAAPPPPPPFRRHVVMH